MSSDAEPFPRCVPGGSPLSVFPSVIDLFLPPALTPAYPSTGWVGTPKQEMTPCLSFLQELKMSGGNVDPKF